MKLLGAALIIGILAQGKAIEQSAKGKKYFAMMDSTTPDGLMDFSFDDLGNDGSGNDAPCSPAAAGCTNASLVPVEARHQDILLEQLIVQLWNDFGRDLREDSNSSSNRIDPLDVDALLERPVALKQTGAMYHADVKMHNMSVTGLSTLALESVNASRSKNLTDLSVGLVIKCPIISVKGLYSLKGTFGWWLLDSHGKQNFSISMVNVSVAVFISIDMNAEATCSDGQAHVTGIEMPLSYDDVDFRFDKLGSFANQAVNGVGIYYFLQSQEKLLVDKFRSIIRAKANSLIC